MPANFNKLIASLGRVFAAAKANGQLADLEDSIDHADVRQVGDQWNNGTHGNKPMVSTGIPLAASGRGAEDAVHEYSKDIQPGDGITQGYQALSDQLSMLSTRMEKSEHAIVAISQFFATAMKGDAAAMFGAGDEDDKLDEEGKKDPDGNSTEKGKQPHVDAIGNVAELFRSLSGASRTTGKTGLAPVPSMVTIKARRDSLQDILDQDDGSSYPMHARMEIASIQAAMANLDGGMLRDTHLNSSIRRASPQAREALVKANITF
jgi:hypothetical protein